MLSYLAAVDIPAFLNSEHCRCDTGILEGFYVIPTDNEALIVSLTEVPHGTFRVSAAGGDSSFAYSSCLCSFHIVLLLALVTSGAGDDLAAVEAELAVD
jgi:hypothetical protein